MQLWFIHFHSGTIVLCDSATMYSPYCDYRLNVLASLLLGTKLLCTFFLPVCLGTHF